MLIQTNFQLNSEFFLEEILKIYLNFKKYMLQAKIYIYITVHYLHTVMTFWRKKLEVNQLYVHGQL